jgi:hypothetical protein
MVWTHWPFPSHAEVISPDGPTQALAAQAVSFANSAQWPVPSQRPVVPQPATGVAMHTPAGSGPAGTGAHVPSFPGIAQELQLPQDGEAQHSPSVPWLLMQSVPVTQAAPFGLRFVQEPDWQVFPAAQSPSPEQVVRQAPGPHT